MNKVSALMIVAALGCSYASLATANDNPDLQERIEMENKQARLMHTEDVVSPQQGERTTLLQAPVKTDDAQTAKPEPQQQ